MIDLPHHDATRDEPNAVCGEIAKLGSTVMCLVHNSFPMPAVAVTAAAPKLALTVARAAARNVVCASFE